MPINLSKIKSQIAKLQKQADSIESGIVARMRADIAKYGLTAEQLFGASSPSSRTTRVSAKPKVSARAGSARAAKFADGAGNTWGGMGKRPQWIRDALEAGKSLDDFLVAGKKAAAKAEPDMKAAPVKKAKAAPMRKRVVAKKASPAKATKGPAAKRSAKAPAKKVAVKKPAKRAAAAPAEPTPAA